MYSLSSNVDLFDMGKFIYLLNGILIKPLIHCSVFEYSPDDGSISDIFSMCCIAIDLVTILASDSNILNLIGIEFHLCYLYS